MTSKDSISIMLLLFLLTSSTVLADTDAFVGVNIGTDISDMPSPKLVVSLLKEQKIQHVRLYDADPALLKALANTGITVMVSIPSEQIIGIGQSNITAVNWVARNVTAHFPATNITAIALGSEILSSSPSIGPVLVSALEFIQSALVASNLNEHIKVSIPISSSIILDSFPPSQAFFNRTWEAFLVPFLQFLRSTGSYFMLNAYPYYDYMQANGIIPLDYALFGPLAPSKEAVDPNTLLHYTNIFDALVDATYYAMANLNVTNVPVLVTESGWPSRGDADEPDATSIHAETYNNNLIKHVIGKAGTPKHPRIAVSTYIYELYNEDMRLGPVSEKNWGLFYSSGSPIYAFNLTGGSGGTMNNTNKNTFCVAKDGADPKMLQAGLDWACGPGKVDCSPLQQGQTCYEPDNVIAHSTYAFNAYFQRTTKFQGTCDFHGVAIVSTRDPSHGSCTFPGSSGGIGLLANNTALVPSSNSTISGTFPPYRIGYFITLATISFQFGAAAMLQNHLVSC